MAIDNANGTTSNMWMYNSWNTLVVDNGIQLRNRERIRKVQKARGETGLGSVAFLSTLAGVFGIVALGLLQWIMMTPSSAIGEMIGAGIMILMTGICFFIARGVYTRKSSNPINGYLLNYKNCEFADGQLTMAAMKADPDTQMQKIYVEGRCKTPEGEELVFVEEFASEIWPFLNPEENPQKKENPMLKKEKRPALPIPVFIIYLKRKPRTAALVGIQRDLIDNALKNFK